MRPQHHAQHRVVALSFVVDEVLVAQRDPEDPLAHKAGNVVHHTSGRASVGEAGSEAVHQPDRPVRGTQQQGTRVRGHHAADEIGRNW